MKENKEQTRIRDEQLRLARQTSRSDFNFATLANSTQSEMTMQEQTNQAYISMPIQFAMSIQQPV